MPYDNVKASPTYLPFQSDITFNVLGPAVTTTYVLTAGTGSAFGAISGYVLNNDSSSASATVTLLAQGAAIGVPFTIAPGQYRTIFAVGADEIAISLGTGVTGLATGELHTVINANPM